MNLFAGADTTQTGRCIGYARVSTDDQKLDLQMDLLREAGCELIFADHGVSGRKDTRPELDKMLETLSPHDMLYVYKVSRLGRSSMHLALLLKRFIENDIGFCSLSEGINITTASGKLMYHMIAAFAEFDADIISENTINGMAAAKARGQHLGRPYKLTPRQIINARRMVDAKGQSLSDIATLYGVSTITLERAFTRLESEAA